METSGLFNRSPTFGEFRVNEPPGGDVRPPLAGYRSELLTLTAEATGSAARSWLIIGDPGNGKTRLLQEVVGGIGDLPWAGLSAAPDGKSYELRHFELEPHLRALSPRTRLLVIDDVNEVVLLDPDASEREITERPGMSVFCSARNERLDPDWARLLAAGGREIRVMRLDGLGEQESRALLGALGFADDSLVDRVTRNARCNPRHLLELARWNSENGTQDIDGLSLATILGPDGRPLQPADARFRRVELIARGISDTLIPALAEHPEIMHELSWRKFEELVAELYRREGFEVELTRASKDGGVDIYAVQRAPFGSFLTIVDCKRYRADRPVELGLVKQLYGTVVATDASVGVIATTAYFSKGARAFQEERKHRLGLQDFVSLREMLWRETRRSSP